MKMLNTILVLVPMMALSQNPNLTNLNGPHPNLANVNFQANPFHANNPVPVQSASVSHPISNVSNKAPAQNDNSNAGENIFNPVEMTQRGRGLNTAVSPAAQQKIPLQAENKKEKQKEASAYEVKLSFPKIQVGNFGSGKAMASSTRKHLYRKLLVKTSRKFAAKHGKRKGKFTLDKCWGQS